VADVRGLYDSLVCKAVFIGIAPDCRKYTLLAAKVARPIVIRSDGLRVPRQVLHGMPILRYCLLSTKRLQ